MPIAITVRKFELVATPDPEEFSFRVKVDGNTCRSDSFAGKKGQAYTSFDFSLLRSVSDGWGSYVYTNAEDAGDGDLWLYFAKDKTAAQLKVPFRVSTSFGDKEWDNVILALNLVKDTGMTRTSTAFTGNRKITLSGPRYSLRPVIVPGGAKGTQFVRREFLSPLEFKIPNHETPIPSLVAYDVDGFEGQLTGLHEDLSIKARRTVVSASNGVAPVGVMAGQFFPATNFTTWEDHVISDEQSFVGGVWHRVQVEVIAPELDEAISLNR